MASGVSCILHTIPEGILFNMVLQLYLLQVIHCSTEAELLDYMYDTKEQCEQFLTSFNEKPRGTYLCYSDPATLTKYYKLSGLNNRN